MQKITPFLWFDNNAEEAMNFYVSVFKDAAIGNIHRMGDKVLTASFIINGQEFMVLNGGPLFKFNESISLFVNCADQAEVDYLWDTLTADGGQPSQCGDRRGELSARSLPHGSGTNRRGHASSGLQDRWRSRHTGAD